MATGAATRTRPAIAHSLRWSTDSLAMIAVACALWGIAPLSAIAASVYRRSAASDWTR